MTQQYIISLIEEASKEVGITWPLYGFVTSNPLSGHEKEPFKLAVEKAASHTGSKVFPEVAHYRKAFTSGAIDREILNRLFSKNKISLSPEESLSILENQREKRLENPLQGIDQVTVKWLSAFMDEGLAEWSMPGKEKGFYQAWRSLAPYDSDLKASAKTSIPEDATEAIRQVLKNYKTEDHLAILQLQLSALPGWTGYIKYRLQNNSAWQHQYPVSLTDYLGVRLWMADAMKTSLAPQDLLTEVDEKTTQLQLLWLQAWESTWQQQTLKALASQRGKRKPNKDTPEAQLVFCIDTRSEPIRRQIEAVGNYETYGYAGFFGITMDYQDPETGLVRKSCPPIVASSYQVSEAPRAQMEGAYEKFQEKTKKKIFFKYFLKRMKNMLPSTFGFVEGSGLVYGFGLLGRTLFPRIWYQRQQQGAASFEGLCEPGIRHSDEGHDHPHTDGIPLEEKIGIVRSGFNLMGWKDFAPLVVFTGHGSHTSNNPFGSSLDCGACAASPGRHNARMLAKMANMKEVREGLLKQYDIEIPEDTLFLAGEHNTTTDEIILFDENIPESHQAKVNQLKNNLKVVQQKATKARLKTDGDSVKAAQGKAGNWAETRPEWGLAKNAGFIIAPRTTTKELDLEGRCFLHSYNWKQDEDGKFLEGIMQGPMVVTQWINNHYYFSTVDNQRFGSGSKITQNVTGMFAVVQGNGGDLKSGLPLQSLKENDRDLYHQPLRLSVIIEAPVEWVTQILERNDSLRSLLDNQWIYLIVNDPTKDYMNFHYKSALQWEPAVEEVVFSRKSEEVLMK